MEILESYQKVRRLPGDLLVVALVIVLAVAIGCQTADPAADDSPVVVTGTPVGGGPTEDDSPYDVAKLETALERPALYVGNTLMGQATVYQVVTERMFWLESGERRILTVLRERDTTVGDIGLRRGQVLQLSGELRSADDLEPFSDSAASGLSSEAMVMINSQEYYLVVSANTLEIITREVADRVEGRLR
jgi:hypothetical protein